MTYCPYCGNEQSNPTNPDHACDKCAVKFANPDSPLRGAWLFFNRFTDRFTVCCFSLNDDHFHFHSDEFSSRYPDPEEEGVVSTCVESGINFYANRLSTYFIFDSDDYSDGNEFGEVFQFGGLDPSPQEGESGEMTLFIDEVQEQLMRGAQAAWNRDICTCEHCGYHYIETPCRCQDRGDYLDQKEEGS